MPYFPSAGQVKAIQPPEMIHQEMIRVEGGIVAMGSHALDQRWHNCRPRLVRVDSFSLAPTCVTVGLQRQVMEGVEDKAPDNYPGIFSFDDNVAFCQSLSAMTGQRFGIGTEAEWEYAARDRIDDVRRWMAQHSELGLKTISDLRGWLIDGDGWLENFVVLGPDEKLRLGSRLVTDPSDPEFVAVLERAARIGCWTVFSGDRGLTQEAFYFGQAGRRPVKYGQPNQKGVWDMTAGMLEWCADVYRQDAYQLPPDNPFNAPKEPKDRSVRVQRGGSWIIDDRDFQVACRLLDFLVRRRSDVGARLFGPA